MLIGSAVFGATFDLVTRVGSPEINNLALNNCFSYRNVFQNGVNALSKTIKKFPFFFFFFFVKKVKFSWSLDHIIICSNFTSMWSKYLSNNVWRDFRLPLSAFAMVAGESFNGKFTVKIDFPIGYFIFPLLLLTLEKVGSHTWVWSRILDILILQDKTLFCACVDNFKQNGVFWRHCACVDNFKQNGVFWRQGYTPSGFR